MIPGAGGLGGDDGEGYLERVTGLGESGWKGGGEGEEDKKAEGWG